MEWKVDYTKQLCVIYLWGGLRIWVSITGVCTIRIMGTAASMGTAVNVANATRTLHLACAQHTAHTAASLTTPLSTQLLYFA